jgi:hypothetical protein
MAPHVRESRTRARHWKPSSGSAISRDWPARGGEGPGPLGPACRCQLERGARETSVVGPRSCFFLQWAKLGAAGPIRLGLFPIFFLFSSFLFMFEFLNLNPNSTVIFDFELDVLVQDVDMK